MTLIERQGPNNKPSGLLSITHAHTPATHLNAREKEEAKPYSKEPQTALGGKVVLSCADSLSSQ